MSNNEDEEGLFGTEVTWIDVESEIRAALNTKAVFGANKSIKQIGDGTGFLSKVGLVNPDWQNVSESDELPEKFVVKIASILSVLAISAKLSALRGVKDAFASVERQQKLRRSLHHLHNTEVTIYRLLAKYDCKLPVSKIYCARKYTDDNRSKAFLVMDYAENDAGVDLFTNVDVKDIRKMLPVIANLQATSLVMSTEELAQFPRNPIQTHFDAVYTKEGYKGASANLRWFETERMKELMRLVDENISDIVNLEFYDSIPEQMNIKRVLSHGDLWPANCIWGHNGDGIEPKAILDWQLTSVGVPAADFAKFFCTHMSGEDRRNYTEILLEEFYEIFRTMVEKVNKEMPYTLEELKESYKRFFPIAAAIAFPLGGGVGRTLMEKFSLEKKQRCHEILCEKLTCMVEDMIHYHKRNMELQSIKI